MEKFHSEMDVSEKESEALALLNPDDVQLYLTRFLIEKNGDILRNVTLDHMEDSTQELAEAMRKALLDQLSTDDLRAFSEELPEQFID